MPRKQGITDEEKNLVLQSIAVGKANSISAREIADHTNMRSDRTDVRIRSIISSLIEDGHPIGSWAGGYYILETEEELQEVLEGIRVRIRGMQQRLASVEENFRLAH